MSNNHTSDAKWYFEQFTGEREKYYEVFMSMCRKFGVTWSLATEEEKVFIEALTKFTMQRNADQRFCGKPLMGITPVFEIV